MMALDQGTTSSRCIIFDEKGRIVSSEQQEFQQMADPANGKAEPAGRDTAHHDEPDRHHYGHGSYDAKLRSHCHGTPPYKTVQMFFIKTGPDEPVMQPP